MPYFRALCNKSGHAVVGIAPLNLSCKQHPLPQVKVIYNVQKCVQSICEEQRLCALTCLYRYQTHRRRQYA